MLLLNKIIFVVICLLSSSSTGTLHAKDSLTINDKLYSVIKTFEKTYINAKFDSLLDESFYQEAVKKGQNNVPRSLAATAIVFAFLSRTDKSTQYNQRAQYLIEETLRKYPLWTSSLLPTEESFNLAPTTAYNIGLASWLLWDSLNRETQRKVKEMLIKESNYQLLRNPASGYEKDTKAEENSIVPALLVLTSQLFPEEQKAELWEVKARCFAYHTITVKNDSAYCGLKTITAYDNFDMDNHNFGPHPLYMAAPLVHFADATLVYKAVGKNIPIEFKHNIIPLWEQLKNYLSSDYSWSVYSSWQPTGLSREISGATFMAVIMNVDWEIENSLLSYKVKNQKYFVEKKVDVVKGQQYYDTDWFNNCIVAKRYVVSWLLHNPKILPITPLMIN